MHLGVFLEISKSLGVVNLGILKVFLEKIPLILLTHFETLN